MKRLHRAIVVVFLAFSASLLARTDMTTDMIDMWDMDESSGNIVGEHAGITLTQTGGTIGTGTCGGRAARSFNGSSLHFTIADSPALSVADESFTVAARFTLTDSSPFHARGLVGKSDYATDREWVL